MSDWTADGPPQEDGVVGGDGAGTAYSVRYTRADKPGSLITSYWYAVSEAERYNDDPGPDARTGFDVENQVEFVVCTDPADPGSTEVWSDHSYRTPLESVFDTEDEAVAYAKRQAADEDPYGYFWDGELPS